MQEQIKQAPIWVVVLVLVVVSVNQSEHNKLIREQIKQIHASLIMQIREVRKLEERITDKTNEMNLRIAQLEVKNEMWTLPVYNDNKKGSIYVDRRDK